MSLLYHVDAESKTDQEVVVRDFHLETLSVAEAEHAYLDCWFAGRFWSVKIWKEVVKEEGVKL